MPVQSPGRKDSPNGPKFSRRGGQSGGTTLPGASVRLSRSRRYWSGGVCPATPAQACALERSAQLPDGPWRVVMAISPTPLAGCLTGRADDPEEGPVAEGRICCPGATLSPRCGPRKHAQSFFPENRQVGLGGGKSPQLGTFWYCVGQWLTSGRHRPPQWQITGQAPFEFRPDPPIPPAGQGFEHLGDGILAHGRLGERISGGADPPNLRSAHSRLPEA